MSLFDRTPDRRERTPEERERARAQREARRAAREGREPVEIPPLPDPDPAGVWPPEPTLAAPEPTPAAPEPTLAPPEAEPVPAAPEPTPAAPEPTLAPPEAAPVPIEAAPASPEPALAPPQPAPAPSEASPAPPPEPVRPPEAAPAPQRTHPEPLLQARRAPRAAPAAPTAPRRTVSPASREAIIAAARSRERGGVAAERTQEDWSTDGGSSNGARDGAGDGDGGRWRPRLRPPREPGPPGGGRTGRPRSRRRRIAAAIVGVAVLAVAWLLISLLQPLHGSGHGAVEVRIPGNVGLGKIGDTLAQRGVVSSSVFFSLRARLAGHSGDLKPGLYTLKRDMTYAAAIDALAKGPGAAQTIDLTIPEGRSIRETDARLKAAKIPLAGSYAAAARRSKLLDPRRYGAPKRTATLEGFLFPSTYQVRTGAPVSTLIDKQVVTFKAQFAKVDMREAARDKLRPYDVLVIASMIEREAVLDRERPLIAAVIYHRIKQGIPLYIDATTRYELNDWTRPLTESDFDKSPYDTRHHKDLPPTPIGNPGLASINAAAHPAKVSYLYYVVKPGRCGEHAFSSSYSQFLKDAKRYDTARAAAGERSPTTCK
jgi:uncharacterized YceG family protein